MNIGFDNDLYVQKQTEKILERIKKYDNKLYLEFGGKLFDDMHASRVLPGFAPDAKISLLKTLKDKLEIIFVISAADIERNKIRADFGITYGMEVCRLIDNFRNLGIYVNSIVITQYQGQPQADVYRKKLQKRGEKVYIHRPTKGYPTNVNLIVSDDGYGANPYIETTRPLVVVTAPGPGSGKLATCLSQLYHEYKRGVQAGYAKFETFPIWNLPLKHPVNMAYEAATADIKDSNMIDPFHLEAYGVSTVNYNRDLEVFPVVKAIFNKITGRTDYASPTDMGVNMAGYAITDDDAVKEAAKQEIIRRYYKNKCYLGQGIVDEETAQRVELIMNELDITPHDRKVVEPALKKSQKSKSPSMAIMLRNGEIVTGRQSHYMTAASSVVINSLKVMAGINDEIMLISPLVLETILDTKRSKLGDSGYLLNLDDMFIALSISAATNPTTKLALQQMENFKGCEAHSSHMLSSSEEDVLRMLKINYTEEAAYAGGLYFV